MSFASSRSYVELEADSLKAAKVAHGLQTTAIYWETNLNPFNGAFGQAAYGQKWSWKIFDDAVRKYARVDVDVRNHPYLFVNDQPFDRAWLRDYKGDRDMYDLVPGKKKYNFSFFPTGTKDPLSKPEGKVTRADAFNAVLASCLKVDLSHALGGI